MSLKQCPNCNIATEKKNLFKCINETFDLGRPEYPYHPYYNKTPYVCCLKCKDEYLNKCEYCGNVACDGEFEGCYGCDKTICPSCQGIEDDICDNCNTKSDGYPICDTCCNRKCECGNDLKCVICLKVCFDCWRLKNKYKLERIILK